MNWAANRATDAHANNQSPRTTSGTPESRDGLHKAQKTLPRSVATQPTVRASLLVLGCSRGRRRGLGDVGTVRLCLLDTTCQKPDDRLMERGEALSELC